MKHKIDRREFIGSMTALSASPAFAQTARRGQVPAGRLPQRGEILVRNAYVMTMDPQLGDIPGGDVHIRNGQIIAVGKSLTAPGAVILDGRRRIVLPGLVETHWHMWNTLLRSFAGDQAGQGYFATAAAFGAAMTPDDMLGDTLVQGHGTGERIGKYVRNLPGVEEGRHQ